jgi:hypothetical protein
LHAPRLEPAHAALLPRRRCCKYTLTSAVDIGAPCEVVQHATWLSVCGLLFVAAFTRIHPRWGQLVRGPPRALAGGFLVACAAAAATVAPRSWRPPPGPGGAVTRRWRPLRRARGAGRRGAARARSQWGCCSAAGGASPASHPLAWWRRRAPVTHDRRRTRSLSEQPRTAGRGLT